MSRRYSVNINYKFHFSHFPFIVSQPNVIKIPVESVRLKFMKNDKTLWEQTNDKYAPKSIVPSEGYDRIEDNFGRILYEKGIQPVIVPKEITREMFTPFPIIFHDATGMEKVMIHDVSLHLTRYHRSIIGHSFLSSREEDRVYTSEADEDTE